MGGDGGCCCCSSTIIIIYAPASLIHHYATTGFRNGSDTAYFSKDDKIDVSVKLEYPSALSLKVNSFYPVG